MKNSRLLAYGSPWHLFSLSTLYFAQGLPSGFLGFGLTTFLTVQGASIMEISSLLSITMIPWTIKFLLGPLVDGFTVFRFGRRRFWILLSQLLMIVSLVPLFFIENGQYSLSMAIVLAIHNLFVATQDIATDALAADSLEKKALGKANGLMWGSKVFARGIGVSASVAIYLSFGVSAGLLVLMATIGLIMLVPLLSEELDHKVGAKEEVKQANRMPFKELLSEVLQGFNTKPALWALLFMTISGISVGIYDVLFNKFFMEELAWTGEQIGAARPWGMWLGGATGLLVGIAVSFYGSRYLLLGFVVLEFLLYLFLGTVDVEILSKNGFVILLGVDVAVVASQVIMFALLMSLCVTKTSATNFGFFMGLANLSTLIGNQIAPVSFATFGYAGSFVLGSIILVPCLFIIPLMTRSNEKRAELLIEIN
jgi:MFS transporter, PAT family, beta-lactamase induction signal transducer AmpG